MKSGAEQSERPTQTHDRTDAGRFFSGGGPGDGCPWASQKNDILYTIWCNGMLLGMPRICFTPHLRQHLDCPDCDVRGDTVRGVLDALFERSPKLRSYLVDDQGALRKHVTIFINSRPLTDRQRMTDAVVESDEIFVFQALSGG